MTERAFRLETMHRHPDPDDRDSRDLPWGEHICVDHKAHSGRARDCMATLPNLIPVASESDQ